MGKSTLRKAGKLKQTLIGQIFLFAGAEAPEGWVFCNGASISVSKFTKLFSVIGYTYGGAGDTFVLPDLRSKLPKGAGGSLGLNEGAASHVITQEELPGHTHIATLNATSLGPGGTSPTVNATLCNTGTLGPSAAMYLATVGDASTLVPLNTKSVEVGSLGNGDSISMIPPVLAINYIIAFK